MMFDTTDFISDPIPSDTRAGIGDIDPKLMIFAKAQIDWVGGWAVMDAGWTIGTTAIFYRGWGGVQY